MSSILTNWNEDDVTFSMKYDGQGLIRLISYGKITQITFMAIDKETFLKVMDEIWEITH